MEQCLHAYKLLNTCNYRTQFSRPSTVAYYYYYYYYSYSYWLADAVALLLHCVMCCAVFLRSAGQQATPQLQAAAIDWVVARLADVAAAPAADPGHAAACRRVMEALRSAGAAVAADVADAPVTSAIMR